MTGGRRPAHPLGEFGAAVERPDHPLPRPAPRQRLLRLDRDQFISEEATFRTFAQGIVDRFRTNSFYEIPTEPDGTPVAAGERTSLNFYRFWQGIPFRELYLLTRENPIDSKRFFALSELPAAGDALVTMNGVIDRIDGRAPTAGDARALFGMRIDSPPMSTKAIDGDLSDWTAGSNAVTIFRAPALLPSRSYAEAGEFHVAVDANNLYIAGTKDFTGSPWMYMEVEIESANGYADFYSDVLGGWDASFGSMVDPVYSLGSTFEMAVALTNFPADSWVEVRIRLLNEGFFRLQARSKREGQPAVWRHGENWIWAPGGVTPGRDIEPALVFSGRGLMVSLVDRARWDGSTGTFDGAGGVPLGSTGLDLRDFPPPPAVPGPFQPASIASLFSSGAPSRSTLVFLDRLVLAPPLIVATALAVLLGAGRRPAGLAGLVLGIPLLILLYALAVQLLFTKPTAGLVAQGVFVVVATAALAGPVLLLRRRGPRFG